MQLCIKTALAIVLLHINCAATQSDGDSSKIPDSILKKASDFLKSKVGKEFFATHIRFDTALSAFMKGDSTCGNCEEFLKRDYYDIVFRLYVPECECHESDIIIRTDLKGRIYVKASSYGIPRCPKNDCRNLFRFISKEEAFRIAETAGFEAGLVAWNVSMGYHQADIRDYVWYVTNTLTESSGKTLIIHAKTGKILGTSEWAAGPTIEDYER